MADRHNHLRGRRFTTVLASYLEASGLEVAQRPDMRLSEMFGQDVQASDIVLGRASWSVQTHSGREHDLTRWAKEARRAADLDGSEFGASILYRFSPATVHEQHVLLRLDDFATIVGRLEQRS